MCEEKMLSQLTGDMYEFYQWLKSKCSGVVGVDITYGKTHRDGSEDVCMTFQLQYHWENERDKRKDAGIHKIVAIMEYIAKKFNWDIDIKWFNSYRAATDDVLMIKVINQKENLTTEVKSKMKKLPITKEAFEKSKYFTKKYGKLEYVSESGKVFKTDKGKILKFNESVEYDYALVEDWIKRAKTAVVDARVGLMDKRSKEILLDDAIECLDLLESAFNDSKNNLQGTTFHIDNFPGEQPTPDEQAVPQLNEGTESNPRFKCMEGYDYSDDIREFRDDVISALKKCYGDEYMVKPDMVDGKSILVSDPYAGLDYKIDISVSDEVDM